MSYARQQRWHGALTRDSEKFVDTKVAQLKRITARAFQTWWNSNFRTVTDASQPVSKWHDDAAFDRSQRGPSRGDQQVPRYSRASFTAASRLRGKWVERPECLPERDLPDPESFTRQASLVGLLTTSGVGRPAYQHRVVPSTERLSARINPSRVQCGTKQVQETSCDFETAYIWWKLHPKVRVKESHLD